METVKLAWIEETACEHGEQCLFCKHLDPDTNYCGSVPETEPGNQELTEETAPKKYWKMPPPCPNYLEDGVMRRASNIDPVYNFSVEALAMSDSEIDKKINDLENSIKDASRTGDLEDKKELEAVLAETIALKEQFGK
jgi:hypothetical protein